MEDNMFAEWLKLNEHIWLFWQLNTEIILGIIGVLLSLVILKHEKESATWLKREFEYDEQKDLEKTQRKTRTTKKITETKDGGKVVEETTETSEPMKEENSNGQ
jgi:predicted Holliday junction resolvase-like endonuclease